MVNKTLIDNMHIFSLFTPLTPIPPRALTPITPRALTPGATHDVRVLGHDLDASVCPIAAPPVELQRGHRDSRLVQVLQRVRQRLRRGRDRLWPRTMSCTVMTVPKRCP